MKKTWHIWLALAKKMMQIAANIFLTLFFIIILAPFAFLLQLFFKKTLLGHSLTTRKDSFWIKKTKIKEDMSFATQQ